jgi:hypothetical protein
LARILARYEFADPPDPDGGANGQTPFAVDPFSSGGVECAAAVAGEPSKIVLK